MTDIAILVAEEYERRVKSSSRKQEHVQENVTDVVIVSIRKQFRKEKIDEYVKWVLEPKSQIGVAASVGFFSA